MRATATKEGRLNLQNYEFELLTKKGFNREDYGDLKIFTLTDESSTWLKVYRGTAAKEITYKRYRTEAQALENVANLKANHDRSKAYKAELKANPTKSSHSNCASAIREELKKVFPNVKFSVKSSNFAGGDSVNINWENGPIVKDVEKITNKYQSGHFDGMTDMYEYSNSREDLPQSKYVQTRREISEDVNSVVFEALKEVFAEDTPSDDLKRYAYRIIQKSTIPVGAVVTGLEKSEKSGLIEDCFHLKMSLNEVQHPQAKEMPNFEAVEVPAGEIQIVDYSAKAIAVIGETKPIKDKLKELGGKFNFRLSCGAGWIFPKSKLSELQSFLSGGASEEEEEEETEPQEEAQADNRRHPEFEHRHPLNVCDPESGQYKEALRDYLPETMEATTLHQEIEKTINFLAEIDVKNSGEVSQSVRECARVQEVEIHSSLDDINEAAEGGKVISLCNLFELVNQ